MKHTHHQVLPIQLNIKGAESSSWWGISQHVISWAKLQHQTWTVVHAQSFEQQPLSLQGLKVIWVEKGRWKGWDGNWGSTMEEGDIEGEEGGRDVERRMHCSNEEEPHNDRFKESPPWLGLECQDKPMSDWGRYIVPKASCIWLEGL